jgi:hypothetical protein
LDLISEIRRIALEQLRHDKFKQGHLNGLCAAIRLNAAAHGIWIPLSGTASRALRDALRAPIAASHFCHQMGIMREGDLP